MRRCVRRTGPIVTEGTPTIRCMTLQRSLESLTDDEVLSGLHDAVRLSRGNEASLIAHIGEVDVRRLYSRYAASSMFSYCTDILHLSEAESYRRITVARAARDHPILLEMIADGRLYLTGAAKLVPILTPANRDSLLARAVHKSKRQIEELVAELAPRPDAPSVMRKLPEPARPATPAPVLDLGPCDVASPPPVVLRAHPAAPLPVIEPLSPARYKIQFTAGPELRDDLERLQALMRSEVPDGDLAVIIGKAVREKLQRLEARKFGKTSSPRKPRGRTQTPDSRYIAAETRRAVFRRDG